MSKILFVVTGAQHWTLADGSEHPTGFWAEELAAPYRTFTAAGHEVDVATPGGVVPVVDQASLGADANGGQEQADAVKAELEEIEQLRAPLALEDVDAGERAAVFFPGGHGPMEDLSTDQASARVLTGDAGVRQAPRRRLPRPGRAAGDRGRRGRLAVRRATGSPASPTPRRRRPGWPRRPRGCSRTGWSRWAPTSVRAALGAAHRGGPQPLHRQNPASSAPLAEEMLKAL